MNSTTVFRSACVAGIEELNVHEPAAFWPSGGAWSTGPPHFHPLDATGSTAQASRRRFGLILEPGQQGLLTFIFRAPCSPRWHCFEEVSFFRVSFHSFRQKRDSPSEWAGGGAGVAGGAASRVDGKPPRARLGKEGTLPRVLRLINQWNMLRLHFPLSSQTNSLFIIE